MHFSNFALASVLALTASAATTVSVKKLAASTTTVVPATGTVSMGQLAAIVPIVSATAAYATQTAGAAQIGLTPMGGDGPGVCGQAGASFFTDSVGNQYTLKCGYNLANGQGDTVANGVILTVVGKITWYGCIEACRSVDNCAAVVYSPGYESCYFKNMGNVSHPQVNWSPYFNFAYLPSGLRSPLTTTGASSSATSTVYPPGSTSTTVIAGSGSISIPAVTAVATVANATITLVAGTTVALTVNALWHLGGK